jgi:prevent-host-death family protein
MRRGALRQVGVYDAKTQLPRLLDAVERGEIVTITRHGRPVAKLVPVKGTQRSVEEAIEALREFRKRHPLRGLKIKDLIEEGRRH